MTGEIIDIFKRGMGETGRFYRKARGARTANGRFALQDEASTLSRISSDLRRRMESANYWLEEWREEEGSIKPSAILSEKEMKENTHSKFTGEDNDDDDNDDIESNVKQDDDDESKSSDITASAPCMCKKSKCLKLYCDCFNKEKYCSGCSCIGCNNTHRHNSVRVKAIANIKERNPDAFMPKIKSSIECKCKRTSCLKKYCDCFLHGVYCTETCQCSMCKNVSRKSHANAGLTFNNEASENDDTNFPTSNSSSTTMDSSDHHTASAIQSQKAKVANTASKATTVTPPPKSKPRESDIILSLRNDEYKEIMFTQFRTMGKRLDSSENAVLDVVTHELFAVFKRIMGKDGRFLRSDRHFRDLWVADDEEAVLSKSMGAARIASYALISPFLLQCIQPSQKLRGT